MVTFNEFFASALVVAYASAPYAAWIQVFLLSIITWKLTKKNKN